ncbi:MAG: hypothetical protein V3V03_05700 [Hyphomonadaceae bacterium]
MGLIWWILPAVTGVIGLMLGFAGLGRLARFKPLSGGARLLFGTGFLGFAGIATFTGLNLQTYQRLTYERPVATITFSSVDGQKDTYVADLLLPEGERKSYTLHGDEWLLRARVIKFKPMSNMLGYDSIYRLDRLSGHYEDIEAERNSDVSIESLSADPGLDVYSLAKQSDGKFGVRDAYFGSAVYNPMENGLSYEVSITQDALVARPANALTRMRLGLDEADGEVEKAPRSEDGPAEEDTPAVDTGEEG